MPRTATIVVSVRLTPEMHAAARECAGRTSVGLWVRDLVTAATGVEPSPITRANRPRRPRRAPPDKQLLLREAVRHLGLLGVAVVEHGRDATLAAEIRAALAVIVTAVTPTR